MDICLGSDVVGGIDQKLKWTVFFDDVIKLQQFYGMCHSLSEFFTSSAKMDVLFESMLFLL